MHTHEILQYNSNILVRQVAHKYVGQVVKHM